MLRSRPRLSFALLLAAVFLLLACVCILFAPRRAAASSLDVTPVEVTNWPTPMPTYAPIPTWCASPSAWSSAPGPVCGVAAVSVAHANGEGGLAYFQGIVTLLGLTFIGVCVLVVGLVKR